MRRNNLEHYDVRTDPDGPAMTWAMVRAGVGSASAKALPCHAMPIGAFIHSRAICNAIRPTGSLNPLNSPEETAYSAQPSAADCGAVCRSAVRDWMAGAWRRGKGGGVPRAHVKEYDGALRQLV